jgi:hypothetical protein
VGTGHGLLVAPDVAQLLTAQDLETLRRSAAAGGYRCVACGAGGDLRAGPAAVVVRLGPAPGTGPGGPQAAHVRLAHPGCAPSAVITTATPPLVPADTTMIGTAAVIPHPNGPRALLITELSVHLSSVISAGERGDPALDVLLEGGLHLLPRLGDRAPPSPGWALQLPSRWQAAVLDPAGGAHYDGELEQPRAWRQLVRRQRAAELLTGVIGLRSPATSPQEALALLAEAAHGGRLAGGTITLR